MQAGGEKIDARNGGGDQRFGVAFPNGVAAGRPDNSRGRKDLEFLSDIRVSIPREDPAYQLQIELLQGTNAAA
jgi:hypothetical protein